jgi:ubiquinone/menaquinone biosynthesis C-methylase UbiE
MVDASEQAEKMAALFNNLSDTYDDVGVDFFQPIASTLTDAMAPLPGERWLDIGCGRGAVLLPIAKAIGPTGRAVGLDISVGMIEHSRALAKEAGLTNVDCFVDDAQAPMLSKGPFDTISSCLVLFFLEDPLHALRNWLLLLKPGGRLGVTTFGESDPRWKHVDEVFQPYLPPQMRDARTNGKAGPFESDLKMEQLLRDAGFSNVHTLTATIPVRFANAEQWYAFTWSVGQRMMWLAIPEELRSQVRKEAELRLAEYAEPDGSVVFQQKIRNTFGVVPIL